MKFFESDFNDFFLKDLDPDDIMVLDGGDELYLWIGKGSTEEEKLKSLEMANVSGSTW